MFGYDGKTRMNVMPIQHLTELNYTAIYMTLRKKTIICNRSIRSIWFAKSGINYEKYGGKWKTVMCTLCDAIRKFLFRSSQQNQQNVPRSKYTYTFDVWAEWLGLEVPSKSLLFPSVCRWIDLWFLCWPPCVPVPQLTVYPLHMPINVLHWCYLRECWISRNVNRS